MTTQPTTLSHEEEVELIRLLGKVGSVMSAGVFTAVAAKFALPTVETVIMRKIESEGVQVLLTQRPSDDATPALRNKWHSPGTMLRASD